MKFSSKKDLEGLGEHARKQISAALLESKGKRIFRSPCMDSEQSSPPEKVEPDLNTTIKKIRPARIMKHAISGLNYCPWPSPDPGAWLHTLLERRFGNVWEDGDLATEVILPGHVVRFRFDYAILSRRIFIEMDGFGYHRTLDAFKRDREKQKHALKHGWVVHRLTNSDIRQGFEAIIPDIEVMLSHRPLFSRWQLEPVGKTQCRFIDLEGCP